MSKITKQNVGGTDYTMVGCALTGVCASAADAFIKAVTLSDGDEISDGMTVIVTFANGNTAGTAPASKTIYSSDQVNYYEDTGLTIPFTLAPAGCYEITYTGTGNAYTYISYPVIQIGNITGVICDASGNTVSGSLWTKGAQVGIMFKDGKFLLVSGALLNNMSALPTDAVLHYSFDDLPDYPDGTADVRLLNNNTYNIQSTSQMFNNNGGATFSNVNGNLQIVAVGDSAGVYITNASIENKILKFKIKVTSLVGALRVRNGILNVIETITSVGEYVICYLHKNDAETNKGLYILCESAGADSSCTYTVEQIYVGDGSYTTPIIDNANGQWNSTSQSGVAVQGVSGKGLKLYANSVDCGVFNFNDNFTISLWVNPDNNTEGLIGTLISRPYCLYLRNGNATNNKILLGLYNTSTSNYTNYTNIANLLATGQNHVVLIKNRTNVYMYINGVKINITSSAPANIARNSNDLYIGSTSDTRPQTIDDLLIFDRALSEAEVMALYLNKANTPKYFPAPTDKIEQDNWGLATSAGVFGFTLKKLFEGRATNDGVNTHLSVNTAPKNFGRLYIVIASGQWGSGSSTGAAIYMIRCGYDGNNFELVSVVKSHVVQQYALNITVNSDGEIILQSPSGVWRAIILSNIN